MTVTRVLISGRFSKDRILELRTLGFDVEHVPVATQAELLKGVAAFEPQAILVRTAVIDEELLNAATGLRLVVRLGTGTDNIAVDSCADRGIAISSCRGKSAAAVAELAFGLILAIDRHIPENILDLRNGLWRKGRYSASQGLKSQSIGIIGFGSVGRAMAQRAKGFEMRVMAWSRSLTAELATHSEIVRCSSVREVASKCDIVSLHLSLNSDTEKIFDTSVIGALRGGATVINTARAGLIDHVALLEAVETRGIKVGLDVYPDEPIDLDGSVSITPLIAHPNVYGTHHIGGSTEEAQSAIAADAICTLYQFSQTGLVRNGVFSSGSIQR